MMFLGYRRGIERVELPHLRMAIIGRGPSIHPRAVGREHDVRAVVERGDGDAGLG